MVIRTGALVRTWGEITRWPHALRNSFMMHLTFSSTHALNVRRCARCWPKTADVVAPVPHRSSRPHVQLIAHASEDAAETKQGAAPHASGAAASPKSSEADVPRPMERVKAALRSSTDVDKSCLQAAMAELEAEMAGLQETVAAAESRAFGLEADAATIKDQLLRLNADFENFRRRTRDEKLHLADRVRVDVVAQLLPVVDQFEQARTQVKGETEEEQNIITSYQSLYKQFVTCMRALGVEAVPALGQRFDPSVHEAVSKEHSSKVPEGTVLQEVRKGFKLKDTLLRPALVKVSVAGGGDTTPSAPESASESTSEPVAEVAAEAAAEAAADPAA